MRYGRGLSRRGMGALTQADVAATNQRLELLSRALSDQFSIIHEARQAGFDRGVIEAASAAHGRLLERLSVLQQQASALEPGSLQAWLTNAQILEGDVTVLATETQGQIQGTSSKRTATIVVATLVSLGVAGGLAALVWYASGRWGGPT